MGSQGTAAEPNAATTRAGLRAGPTAAAPAPSEPSAITMDDKLAQLKQLGELRDAGVLSDAEFEVQKDKILHG